MRPAVAPVLLGWICIPKASHQTSHTAVQLHRPSSNALPSPCADILSPQLAACIEAAVEPTIWFRLVSVDCGVARAALAARARSARSALQSWLQDKWRADVAAVAERSVVAWLPLTLLALLAVLVI